MRRYDLGSGISLGSRVFSCTRRSPAGVGLKGDGGADYIHRAFVRSIWAVHREQQNFPGVGIAAAVMGLARLRGRGAAFGEQDLSHVTSRVSSNGSM